MRLVRLGTESSKVGADIRAALSAWGEGGEVLGGVAVLGCTPPGCTSPLDAVIVLPRGLIVVTGIDLPEPALRLEAPLHTPWTVDGWPLVRTEGAVNPALEAMEAASSLARHLQDQGMEPLPVTTVVAVGPFVEQVIQPANDLHRGVRVLYPSTTSVLAAARELATYQRACPVEQVSPILESLDDQAGQLSVAELSAEGFPDLVGPDLAAAQTIHIPKITDSSPAAYQQSPGTTPVRWIRRYAKHIALGSGVLVLLAVISLLVGINQTGQASPPPPPPVRVDGVDFTQRGAQHDKDCGRHSFGDIQGWFQQNPCIGLSRTVFDAQIAGRQAAVAVAVVKTGDENTARRLQDLADGAGTGGIHDLLAEGHEWPGRPRSFDNAAQAVQRDGDQVRIVQAVWSSGFSLTSDVALRALTERGMRLPPRS